MATRNLLTGQTTWNAAAFGGSLPATGDDVNANNSGAALVSLLNQAAVNLKTLDFSGGFTGNVGASTTNALLIDVNSTGGKTFRWAGPGTCYWGGTTDTLTVSDGVFYIVSGTVTNLIVEGNAQVFILESAVVTNVSTSGAGSPSVVAEYNATAITLAKIFAGSLTSRRSVATGHSDNRALAVLESTDAGDAAVTTKWNVNGASRLNHKSGGTIADIEVRPNSRYDRSGATKDASVTSSTFWSGAKVNAFAPGVTTSINGSGGTNASTVLGTRDFEIVI